MMKGKSSNFLKPSLCTNSHSFYLKLLTVEFQTFMHLTFWTFVLKLFLYIPKSVIFWIVSSPFALNNSVVKTFLSKILHFLPVLLKIPLNMKCWKKREIVIIGKILWCKIKPNYVWPRRSRMREGVLTNRNRSRKNHYSGRLTHWSFALNLGRTFGR